MAPFRSVCHQTKHLGRVGRGTAERAGKSLSQNPSNFPATAVLIS